MRRSPFCTIVFTLIVAASCQPLGANTVRSINILYIAGGEAGSHHVDTVLASMEAGLLQSGVNASIFMESLDELRFSLTESVMRLVARDIDERFGTLRFDIILAQSGSSVDFALRYRRERALQLPIYAFDIVEASTAKRLSGERDLYGRILNEPFPPTLRIASSFFPRARKAVLVVPMGRIGNEDFLGLVDAARKEQPSLEIRILSSEDASDIDAAFASGTSDTIGLILTHTLAAPGGKTISDKAIATYLTAKYDVPLFNITRSLLGTGFIGGYSDDEESTGREAASMVLDILYGKGKPSPWKISELPPPSLDYRALKRYSIPMDRVPKGAQVLFAPPPFWLRYQLQLEIAGLLLVLVSIALVAYTVVRRHDRETLRQSNEELERKVIERTDDLRTANDELSVANENLSGSLHRIEDMQTRLIAETKEVVMGRLALGLAHEINNPLGAIRSANAAILDVLAEGSDGLAARVLAMDAGRQRLFVRFMGRAARLPSELAPLSPENRAALLDILRSIGVEDEYSVADELEDSALAGLAPEELREICAPENRTVLDALFYSSVLATSAAVSDISAKRIAETVEAIRSYAREREQGAESAVDIRDSLDRALLFFRETAKKGISIVKDYGSFRPQIKADESAFVRLWTNLIQNAFQAMGEEGELSLRVAGEDGFAVVEIGDTGPGIPEPLRGGLFEPFASSKVGEGGLGLGLSICRRIVEGYGGAIEYDDSGGYTIFRVKLPLTGGEG
jgi:signal transduction histidine kinase